jgi:hypothetical protein
MSSPSTTIQHQEPLSEKEIQSLTLLFNEVVSADKEAERQLLLNKMYDTVKFLRTLNEYVAWEYDLSAAVTAMEKLNEWLQGIIQLTQDESLKEQSKNLVEEIEQHRNPSSELFLRMAEEAVTLKTNQEAATRCVEAFAAFRKTLGELSHKKQVFPEGYKSFTLSLKAFGLAYKNYKGFSSAFTIAQCGQIFAPVGEEVPIQIPPMEV